MLLVSSLTALLLALFARLSHVLDLFSSSECRVVGLTALFVLFRIFFPWHNDDGGRQGDGGMQLANHGPIARCNMAHVDVGSLSRRLHFPSPPLLFQFEHLRLKKKRKKKIGPYAVFRWCLTRNRRGELGVFFPGPRRAVMRACGSAAAWFGH